MKRFSLGTVVVGIGLAALLAIPRPVLANEHGWATAGKVLTTLVVLGAINQAVQQEYYSEPPRTVYVERPVYVDRPVYTERPVYRGQPVYREPPAPAPDQQPTVIYEGAEYVETPVVTYETRYFQGRRLENCPRVYTRSPHAPREIIVPHGYGRRLYQPGIRGHYSYVQQWQPGKGIWVNIGYFPSVWR